ncbi:MAG: hypothetical protein H6625_02905 [Bdellovibrionaceae bacterium]|nr:hypothetical protein [Pseudobdellovibrionaceae bacterium]
MQLVETSGKTKQERFLKIIEDEDPIWAEAIFQKMLTLEKIMCWDDQVLAEIFSRLTDISLSVASKILSEEQWQRATKTFSHSRLRQLRDAIEGKNPSPSEQSTVIVNILTEVRTMMSEGLLRVDQIDLALVIEDDIEEKLNAQLDANPAKLKVEVDISDVERKLKSTNPEAEEEIKKEMMQLKKKIVILGNENHTLRRENDDLRRKIAQIKKLAA